MTLNQILTYFVEGVFGLFVLLFFVKLAIWIVRDFIADIWE